MKDYYYILGVDTNSTLDEIKDAYRKLSKKLHPDLNMGDKYFEARFRDVKDAFETLRDTNKRYIYDQQLKKLNSSNNYTKSGQSYQNAGYSSGSSRSFKSKSKGPGLGLTLVFVLIALILSDYLIRWFNTPKLIPYQKTTTVSFEPVKTAKHHKKRHNTKNKTSKDSIGLFSDNSNMRTEKAKQINNDVPVKTHTAQPVSNNKKEIAIDKNLQVVNKQSIALNINKPATINVSDLNGGILYTSMVRANATGIINMRKLDNYSSSIIQTIPAKSKVLVLQKGNIYYKVSFNNEVGYIPKWAVETK